jgi:hypothetical protein
MDEQKINGVEKRGKYEHVSFQEISEYLMNKKYPETVQNKSEKANFRRAAKPFNIVSNELRYQKKQNDSSIKQVSSIFKL